MNLLTPMPLHHASLRFAAGKKKKPDETPKPAVGQPAADPAQVTGSADPKAIQYVKMTKPNPTVFDNVQLKGAEVIVFDLETTGLYPKPDSRMKPGEALDDIIEISASRYKDGKLLSSFSRYVKPNKPIPPEVEKLNNYTITNALVQAKGVDIHDALKDFATYLGGPKKAVLVGHNAQGFDTRFIRAVAERYGMGHLKDTFDYDVVVDTFLMAKKFFASKTQPYGAPANLKLNTLAGVFGITNPGAHQAKYDVTTTAGLYFALADAIQKDNTPLDTFGELFKYQFKPKSVPPDMIKTTP